MWTLYLAVFMPVKSRQGCERQAGVIRLEGWNEKVIKVKENLKWRGNELTWTIFTLKWEHAHDFFVFKCRSTSYMCQNKGTEGSTTSSNLMNECAKWTEWSQPVEEKKPEQIRWTQTGHSNQAAESEYSKHGSVFEKIWPPLLNLSRCVTLTPRRKNTQVRAGGEKNNELISKG